MVLAFHREMHFLVPDTRGHYSYIYGSTDTIHVGDEPLASAVLSKVTVNILNECILTTKHFSSNQ